MERKKLIGLQANTYEHPFDRKALDALHGTPGLESLFKKINEYGIEKISRVQYTGSNLRVTQNNFPEVYDVFKEVCQTLDLGYLPELYIKWDYSINAAAIGVVHPLIVINSGCVDLLSKEELMWIVGHEVGHLKSQHQLYHMMASVLPIIGQILGNVTLGLGEIVSQGLLWALLYWSRMSEFTADRAGLLACQNIEAASRVTMKMAGVPQQYFSTMCVNEFIEQAKEFEGYDFNTLNKIGKTWIIMQQTHPWTVMRAAELFKWVESGEYGILLKEPVPRCNEETSINSYMCPKCGVRLGNNDRFCTVCGAKGLSQELATEKVSCCSNCGTALIEDEIFCHKCGCKIN